MVKKVALITGITGQDGAYLARFLLRKAYQVFGVVRFSSCVEQCGRLDELGIRDQVRLIPGDLGDISSLRTAVELCSPAEIYNLAANTFVERSWTEPIATLQVTGIGALNLFEAVRQSRLTCKIFQASSSEMYGNVAKPCDESAPFSPVSPYGVAKLTAHSAAKCYRESFGMFISCGVLFNHESRLRSPQFVTRKISLAVAAIKNGRRNVLRLGNVAARRDWTHASEMVDAMWRMLQCETPGDYVLASGRSETVRRFCELAFESVNLDYNDYLEFDPALVRPIDIQSLESNPFKARMDLQWRADIALEEIVQEMVNCDLQHIRGGE